MSPTLGLGLGETGDRDVSYTRPRPRRDTGRDRQRQGGGCSTHLSPLGLQGRVILQHGGELDVGRGPRLSDSKYLHKAWYALRYQTLIAFLYQSFTSFDKILIGCLW